MTARELIRTGIEADARNIRALKRLPHRQMDVIVGCASQYIMARALGDSDLVALALQNLTDAVEFDH